MCNSQRGLPAPQVCPLFPESLNRRIASPDATRKIVVLRRGPIFAIPHPAVQHKRIITPHCIPFLFPVLCGFYADPKNRDVEGSAGSVGSEIANVRGSAGSAGSEIANVKGSAGSEIANVNVAFTHTVADSAAPANQKCLRAGTLETLGLVFLEHWSSTSIGKGRKNLCLMIAIGKGRKNHGTARKPCCDRWTRTHRF